ncbi:MAG TPA: hypothetical protein VL199_09820 [Burkholderiales bacterium]|nr:hypothetical protein [Burkholderiales bacterium]
MARELSGHAIGSGAAREGGCGGVLAQAVRKTVAKTKFRPMGLPTLRRAG